MLKRIVETLNGAKEYLIDLLSHCTQEEYKPLITYLAGSMEYSDNQGLDWRLEWREDLGKLGIQCIIPNFEEADIILDSEQFQRDKITNLDKYINIMRKIIRKDLAFVEQVDFVITKWDGEKGAGTIGEAQHSFLIGKPNYLVTSLPFHEVPGWFLACFTELFHSKEKLLKFLEVKYGSIRPSK